MWAVWAYGMPSTKAGMGSRAARLIGFPRKSNYWAGELPAYEMPSSVPVSYREGKTGAEKQTEMRAEIEARGQRQKQGQRQDM